MNFKVFSQAVHARYEALARGELFVVDVENIFDSYLAAFPEGTNPVFRVNRAYDCNCCKQFIRKLGTLVGIDSDGNTVSVWDDLEHLPHPFNVVAARLSQLVLQAPIKSVFRSKEGGYGTEHNYDTHTNDRWDHFHGKVGRKHHAQDPEAKRGEQDAIARVLRRGLDELQISDLDDVIGLIESNGLYRGGEHLEAVKSFRNLMAAYQRWNKSKDVFVWANLGYRNARFRNTVIGTLLVDLAAGVPLEDAVKMFEAKVAPANYKRPTALITPRMVDAAVATLKELDLEGAVHRRFARLGDVSVNNVLFVDNKVRGVMKDGVAGLLASSVKQKNIDPKMATTISIDTFLASVVPTAKTISLRLENRHAGNFVSLTGGDGPERLFKWNSNFAWSYEGDVTDSIKQRVKAAGGNVNALLRVSLAWFNWDDLDIHCLMPRGQHICYSNKAGILDVDMNAAGRQDSRTPVENLAFTHLEDGVYKIFVNNFMRKESIDVGFNIEVEYKGNLHQFSYNKGVANKATVEALNITVRKGAVTDIGVGEGLVGGNVSQEKWGVKSETLVPVTVLMNSPNYWDDQAIGQKHVFFMLQGCKSPDAVRGIYNEFLRPEFEKHRKVFEILGAKTKCPPTDDQISGVGFSSARGDTVTVVVNDQRAFNITF